MGLRVALIGAGQVASVHLEALGETDAVELVGIYDQARAGAGARGRNGIPRVYASWEELLRDEAVQCVGVLLPHDLHEQYASRRWRPASTSSARSRSADVAECDRMLAAAERAGRELFPVHNRVYSHAVERMHEIVAAGQIGEVVLAQTTGFEGAADGPEPWLATRAAAAAC